MRQFMGCVASAQSLGQHSCGQLAEVVRPFLLEHSRSHFSLGMSQENTSPLLLRSASMSLRRAMSMVPPLTQACGHPVPQVTMSTSVSTRCIMDSSPQRDAALYHRPSSVWPEEPVPPSKSLDLFIEARVEDVRTEGPFVLKLCEANGPRTVRLGRVAFPVLGTGTAF
jgi:hypothetical protein